MYLHLGDACVVPGEEVVGLFDLDHISAAPKTQEFLEKAEEAGRLTILGRRLPVSLVVTLRGSYLSPVSSQVLGKRLAEDRWE